MRARGLMTSTAGTGRRRVAGIAPGERVGVFVFALHSAGRNRVPAETRKLDEIDTVVADVLAGRVPARVVLEF